MEKIRKKLELIFGKLEIWKKIGQLRENSEIWKNWKFGGNLELWENFGNLEKMWNIGKKIGKKVGNLEKICKFG